MEVILYSTGCPRCEVLIKKLNSKGINFKIITDIKLMEEKNIDAVPQLEVNGTMMDFITANSWLNT